MGLFFALVYIALTGSQLGFGLPLGTPHSSPQDVNEDTEVWGWGSGWYAAGPALALLVAAAGLLLGCTWCYRHKDCKIFTASVSQLNEVPRRSNPPDSGFSEPVNNNISEDNNNGPISLREMQNIANNNATAYIVSENEERNRAASRESVVEFEPLPPLPPLESFADWFVEEEFPRDRLQYLREIGRGWFGRVVEGEVEADGDQSSPVAVKILNPQATLEEKARFLEEARLYRDVTHENVLGLIARCLQQDPWILIFELCPMDLQQYLIVNRPKMAILNENGTPLRLMCDVTNALAYLHSRGFVYSELSTSSVLVRGEGEAARGVLGRYWRAGELERRPPDRAHSAQSDVWRLGVLLWEQCSWEPARAPPPLPEPRLPSPYRAHVYQVMQLCWNHNPAARPTSSQVHALIEHLYTQQRAEASDDGYASSDFEERWQRLKPNSIPVIDEHRALVHAPSTSNASHFTSSERGSNTLSVELDTAVSRSSSILSEPIQLKSESMTNLHGSYDDVRNIYLTHNENAVTECNQANNIEDRQDLSDASVDPWLKDIIAGSQDDVSYYKDVSDVIKNLDNILNSEKTSSSESSHQASPSRDNLILDCKKDYPVQSSLVKSPGIRNFQNVLEMGFDEDEPCVDEDGDRDTIGTLSHSFERHSDTVSQNTLENITPETPIKDIDVVSEMDDRDDLHKVNEVEASTLSNITEMPKDTVVEISDKLMVDNRPSLSENVEQSEVIDCQTSCDITNGTSSTLEPIITKSIEVNISNGKETEDIIGYKLLESSTENQVLDDKVAVEAVNKIIYEESLPSKIVTESSLQKENLDSLDISNHISLDTITTESKDKPPEDKSMLMSEIVQESQDVVDSVIREAEKIVADRIVLGQTLEHLESKEKPDNVSEDHFETQPEQENAKLNEESLTNVEVESEISVHESLLSTECLPKNVQNVESSPSKVRDDDATDITVSESFDERSLDTASTLPIENRPDDLVQNVEETAFVENETTNLGNYTNEVNKALPHELSTNFNDSTVYMNLNNTTAYKIKKDETLDNNLKEVIEKCVNKPSDGDAKDFTLERNDSTVYLDLPNVIKVTGDFLHMERVVTSNHEATFNDLVTASTPKSDVEQVKVTETNVQTEDGRKTPDYGSGYTLTRLEQRCVENISPFDSPTKSHPTDTYDDNSSVVLGPFEYCSLELFKGNKPADIELPKEELLAFSSNFSEINLETPSPLRDVNFLNEVPDIEVNDERKYHDISVAKSDAEIEKDSLEPPSVSERKGPSTPPNSPGIFLASTSQQKYVVDIDLNQGPSNREEDSGMCSLQKEIDINQIELQITSKLAMAENENNMNIEYSGPLTVEGVITDDFIPESYLAGNGGDDEGVRNIFTLDEDCMQALRNELELKLPLAQVASIEPSEDAAEEEGETEPTWHAMEVVVRYPGALSPIQEETDKQLGHYHNDLTYTTSTRTDSSSSYLEPCHNSTDSVTSLGSTHRHTYTVQSRGDTYTVPGTEELRSDQLTMTADSLNNSPAKTGKEEANSPVNDRTYTKEDDEKEANFEQISQISPFILSPSDTSGPENSDNATGVITLSKTPVQTDGKSSKPSETQCLSKATSIDSWCSNDTLFNVEDNFDDLAIEADEAVNEDREKEDTDSSHTLTDNEGQKEHSASTFITHNVDDKSDPCETFTPDSITANCTYTKIKEVDKSSVVKSDVNDSSAKNTQDLAYGTQTSGLATYSNCSKDYMSANDELWRFQQPEMIRRSPIGDDTIVSPPKSNEQSGKTVEISPQLKKDPSVTKMDSVEMTCLHDDSDIEETNEKVNETTNSPDFHYRNMAQSMQSTPLMEVVPEENVEGVVLQLPRGTASPDSVSIIVPNLESFIFSAELRPQDMSCTSNKDTKQDTEHLLEGESRISSQQSIPLPELRTPTYASFEESALFKPQEVHSKSSQSELSAVSSNEEFNRFENSLRHRPQDLCNVENATSILLKSEERSSEFAAGNSAFTDLGQSTSIHSLGISNQTNLTEEVPQIQTGSQLEVQATNVERFPENSVDFFEDEQPHSIIITESPFTTPEANANDTYNSHGAEKDNQTYDSHVLNGTQCDSETNKPVAEVVQVNGLANDRNAPESKPLVPESNLPLESIPTANDLIQIEADPSVAKETNNSIVDKHQNSDSTNGPQELFEQNDAKYATVNFLSETFEELMDSYNEAQNSLEQSKEQAFSSQNVEPSNTVEEIEQSEALNRLQQSVTGEVEGPTVTVNGSAETEVENKMASMMKDFLSNEQRYCEINSHIPLLSDIRFTGPASEQMSTSFSQASPTEPVASRAVPAPRPTLADVIKDWDSDTDDSHSTNSSSGEFIWKDGDGHETPLVPSTFFDHQRDKGGESHGAAEREGWGRSGSGSGSSGSGSGCEGEELAFVPSSWDAGAAPAKSSLRQPAPHLHDAESKKRVVFKRQKYHCVYEYPREPSDVIAPPPADYCSYSEWEAAAAEEAELGYSQLFGSHPLDLYRLRAGAALAGDYDDDFYISSTARPFSSGGAVSSQFFPGGGGGGAGAALALKPPPLQQFPPPPPHPAPAAPAAPSLDFTTPDSGVEDITPLTPASPAIEELDTKLPEPDATIWRSVESGSSSESVSPSSPGSAEALGGLRHTRDKLKLDLPPSPHLASPRHNRVFNFVLEKPRPPNSPHTFSTFGKPAAGAGQSPAAIVLSEQVTSSDEVSEEANEPQTETELAAEKSKAAADSGDEDSGIESSAKASLPPPPPN